MLPPDNTTPTRLPERFLTRPERTPAKAEVAPGDHALDQGGHERKRMDARLRRLKAVRDRGGHRDGHGTPRGERAHEIVSRLGLDAEDAGGRPERLHGDRHAGKEPASAERSEDGVEVGHVLEQLEPGGALPRDDGNVVERWNEDSALVRDDLPGDPLAALLGAIVETHLGPVPARGGELERRRVVRHDDCLLYTSDAADEEDSVDLGG